MHQSDGTDTPATGGLNEKKGGTSKISKVHTTGGRFSGNLGEEQGSAALRGPG